MKPFDLINQVKSELPKSEAEQMLMAILGEERYRLYFNPLPVPESVAQKFFSLVAKRKKGEPIQYLINSANFLDFDLYVDARVLIPRPETEELAMKTIAKLGSPELIIDLGTGSGAIAIALARAFPAAKIIATDISAAALDVAKINIKHYNLSDRITLVLTDLLNFSNSKSLAGRIDCIISNPPYIDRAAIPSLAATVKDYEPTESLDGGKDGFEIIRKIINDGMKFLKPGGLLALEIDPRQKDLILNLIPKVNLEKDFTGNIRFAFIQDNQLLRM
jgi:release factor glutamine methyltransferase